MCLINVIDRYCVFYFHHHHYHQYASVASCLNRWLRITWPSSLLVGIPSWNLGCFMSGSYQAGLRNVGGNTQLIHEIMHGMARLSSLKYAFNHTFNIIGEHRY